MSSRVTPARARVFSRDAVEGVEGDGIGDVATGEVQVDPAGAGAV